MGDRYDHLCTIFLCGDLMIGRGIDQILPFPADPQLYEPYVTDAREYVVFAEQKNGPVPKPVDFSYIWGDALDELEKRNPDVRIVNLETSITNSIDFWRGKGINYKMSPGNLPCLHSASVDCCTLSNNHVLDWGYCGLVQTLDLLDESHISYSGAGRTIQEALRPAVFALRPGFRVLVFSLGSESSGIPPQWRATEKRAGVVIIDEYDKMSIRRIKEQVHAVRQSGDFVIVSIHWGGNWGYEIPAAQTEFAHALIEQAGVDLIHGHSSHHFKAVELYKGKPVLYGCGDFLNDYEGISGFEEFRSDLAIMYFIQVCPQNGEIVNMTLVPLQIRRMQLKKPQMADILHVRSVLNREGEHRGIHFSITEDVLRAHLT